MSRAGMVGRHVEGLEVVVVVLDLGAVVDLVAHGQEDVLELLPRAGERMQPADGAGAAGEGDVDALAGEALVAHAALQPDARFLEACLDVLLEARSAPGPPPCARPRPGRPATS